MRLWQRDPHLRVHQHSFFLEFGVGVGVWDFTACSTSRHLIIDLVLSTVISHCLIVFFEEFNTSITTSHRSRAGIPSIRKPASSELISDSVKL